MVSIAPTPLYLAVEEANKIFKSPIPQRRDLASSCSNKSVDQSSLEQFTGQQQQPPQSLSNILSTTITQQPSNPPIQSPLLPIHQLNSTPSPVPSPKNGDRRQLPVVNRLSHVFGRNSRVDKMVKQSSLGLLTHSPKKSEGNGLGGGVYFLKNHKGTNIGVFKPLDEENGIVTPSSNELSGLKHGTIAGEGGLKEVAAYLFDQRHSGFFKVPATTLVKVHHSQWNDDHPIGSLQQYIPFDDTAEEIGCSKFSVGDVHRIGLLDCLLFNCDRHSGNILVVCKEEDGSYELVPIDHSLCLPSSQALSDSWFDWINFPQSKVDFDKQTKQLILDIDIDEDIHFIGKALPELRNQCLQTLKITTIFVQEAIRSGLLLNQIGILMSRYFDLDRPSAIESIMNSLQKKGLKCSLSNQSQFWTSYQQEVSSFLSKYTTSQQQQ